MKRLIICLSAACVASIGLAQDKPQLKDQKDKASYSIGYDIGETFKKQNVDLNADALFTGLKEGLAGKEAALSKEEREKTLQAFQKEMMEKQIAASKEAATKNAAEGEKFLAENKKKDGVKTTASGLQYKVLKEGSGAPPKETDTVVTNYRGTLIDGTEFDSSYKRNEPASFPVNRVIKGWTEALQLMKPGGKFQLFIPSSLAYGERGAGQLIGPNATLIFEVELLSIKPPEPPATVAPGAAAPSASTTPAAKPSPSTSAAPPAPAKPSPSVPAKPSPSPSAKPK
jgi:FKBP-type peptidyl-prolyl cis-trans isomerase FklB